MKIWLKLACVSALAAVMIGCGTTAEQAEEEVISTEAVDTSTTDTSSTDGVTTESTTDAVTDALPAGITFARNAINDPASPLSQKIIYFDFDQATVLPEYQEVINNHAKYLSDYPDARVRLEGHADERGTREYNIALGERRAKTVRQLMLLQGVGADQVNTISYGEELPAALSHDEEAWALNRRVELVYEAQ